MDSYELDNIKAEKAKAMQRYQTQQNFKKFLYRLEIFVALVSIPCLLSWFHLPFHILYTHLRNFVFQFFNKTFYVFLLTNVIVFVIALCFYLKKDEQNEAQYDIYEEFSNACESHRNITSIYDFSVPEFLESNQSTIYIDKEIAYSANEDKDIRNRIFKNTVDVSESKADVIVGAMNIRQQKEFRRSSTGSHWKVERRELRRSKTGNYSTTMRCVDEPPRRSVKEMSSEEFRSEIENFIAMQKRKQIEERNK